MKVTRKFGKVRVAAIASRTKAGWRKQGWKILGEKQGTLAGTKHRAMILTAQRGQVKIALYVVNWKNRIYTVTFANLAKRWGRALNTINL
jgi:hypothetical protein